MEDKDNISIKNKNNIEDLKKAFYLKKYPDPPVPGFYKIDLLHNLDLKKHDGSIDHHFRKIHTSFTKFFPVNFIDEMRKLEIKDTEPWLLKNQQIDEIYYRQQIERKSIFKRAKEYLEINDLKNFQDDVALSFTNINNDPPHGYEIIEEYPLFPNSTNNFVLINQAFTEVDNFVNKKDESSLVKVCSVGDAIFKYIIQYCKDKILIEIRDGKAFYSNVKYFYKFYK